MLSITKLVAGLIKGSFYCKVPFIKHQNTNMFSTKSDNLGVQNMYCSAACIIVCVLRGTPARGATCACWEQSSKGI